MGRHHVLLSNWPANIYWMKHYRKECSEDNTSVWSVNNAHILWVCNAYIYNRCWWGSCFIKCATKAAGIGSRVALYLANKFLVHRSDQFNWTRLRNLHIEDSCSPYSSNDSFAYWSLKTPQGEHLLRKTMTILTFKWC